MNTAVYLFGKLGGNYTQYPDDYTRNLFASYQKLSEQDMLAIRRKNAIIYYTYVYKIEEGYVGISLVFNSVFCTDVKALFAFFRKTINDLADKKDFLTRNNGQIVLKSLLVDILSKTCKELDDKLSSQIDNFAFQVLPPIHVGMDPSAWKIYSQDGITNDTISETLTNYNRIYIVGDKIVNTQPIQAADTQADNAYSTNEQDEAKVEETQETENSVVNNEDNQVASSSSDGTKRLAVLCIGVLVLFVLVLIWLDTSIQESYQDKVERHIEESSVKNSENSYTKSYQDPVEQYIEELNKECPKYIDEQTTLERIERSNSNLIRIYKDHQYGRDEMAVDTTFAKTLIKQIRLYNIAEGRSVDFERQYTQVDRFYDKNNRYCYSIIISPQEHHNAEIQGDNFKCEESAWYKVLAYNYNDLPLQRFIYNDCTLYSVKRDTTENILIYFIEIPEGTITDRTENEVKTMAKERIEDNIMTIIDYSVLLLASIDKMDLEFVFFEISKSHTHITIPYSFFKNLIINNNFLNYE